MDIMIILQIVVLLGAIYIGVLAASASDMQAVRVYWCWDFVLG